MDVEFLAKKRRKQIMEIEMEMPTPCVICGEIFDLHDGKGGLTHETCEVTVCANCYSKQSTEKDRVDKVRELLENKEEKEDSIDEYDNQMKAAKQWKLEAEDELEEIELQLKNQDYKGDSDNYHYLIDAYY